MRRSQSAELVSSIPIHSFEQELIVLEDGGVATGYAVQGFEDEAEPAATYEAFTQQLAHTIRQFPVGTVIQKLDSYYWQPQGRLSHQAFLYLIVGAPAYEEPQLTFFARGRALVGSPFRHLADHLKTSQDLAKALEATLRPYWKLQKLTAEDHLRTLHAYFNLDFGGASTGLEHTIQHTGEALRVGHKHVQVVSMRSQAEAPTHAANNHKGQGKGVTVPFAWPLTHYLHCPHITTQVIRILDTERMMERWSEELAWSQGATTKERSERQATAKRSEVAAFDEALREREEVLAAMAMVVILYDTATDRLCANVEKTKQAMRRLTMQPMVETFDAANLLFATMPAAGHQCYRGLPMPLETALAQMISISPRKGDHQGIRLADRHGTPLYYDPCKAALDNQNAFVFGPSGSGKSFFNGKMIKERHEAGHIVLVIDSGGTYRRLFEALKGKYIEYSADKPLGLNPFLLKKTQGRYDPTPQKLNFLTQLLGKMWKGDLKENPLSEAQKALLARWLLAYYRQETDTPRLSRFYHWLAAQAQKELELAKLFPFEDFFVVLEPFANGIYQQHFNALDVEMLEENPLICFELAALRNHPKLYPLVVQTLFELAFAIVEAYPTRQKFIDIEEGWSMLDDYSEENIEAFFRKGRKTKTSIRIITQDIEEIKASSVAGAMKSNAATCILLYNDKAALRAAMGAFLGLNELDMEKYASLCRTDTSREILIKEMDAAHVWQVAVSPYEHALLTSKPEERDRITALIQEQGDLQRGIKAWIQERNP